MSRRCSGSAPSSIARSRRPARSSPCGGSRPAVRAWWRGRAGRLARSRAIRCRQSAMDAVVDRLGDRRSRRASAASPLLKASRTRPRRPCRGTRPPRPSRRRRRCSATCRRARSWTRWRAARRHSSDHAGRPSVDSPVNGIFAISLFVAAAPRRCCRAGPSSDRPGRRQGRCRRSSLGELRMDHGVGLAGLSACGAADRRGVDLPGHRRAAGR